MDEVPPELPFLSTVGLMLTYKCTIACPHCIVEAGPHRKEEIPLEQALAWIEEMRHYRNGQIRGLALTGGEPFCQLDNLAQVSSRGAELGFIVSVVTNAFWASSGMEALAVLKAVPAIQVLSVSTDAYHLPFVPLDNIRHAVWAARELGLPYNVAVCTHDEDAPEYLAIVRELSTFVESNQLRLAITYPAGRARKRSRRLDFRTAFEPTVSACAMAASPVVFPNGSVNACIGPVLTLPPSHPLYLGNLYQEPIAQILDRAETNLVLHAIRVWGPHKLVSLLSQSPVHMLLPREYICNCVCDACFKIMSKPILVRELETIFQNPKMRDILSYARLYYLHESALVEHYGVIWEEKVSSDLRCDTADVKLAIANKSLEATR